MYSIFQFDSFPALNLSSTSVAGPSSVSFSHIILNGTLNISRAGVLNTSSGSTTTYTSTVGFGQTRTFTSIVSVTVEIGLYTLTGDTLSLFCSLSGSSAFSGENQSKTKWFSFAAGASTALTPNEYWLAALYKTSRDTSGPGWAILGMNQYPAGVHSTQYTELYEGIALRGRASTTGDLPASIASAAISKERDLMYPYIVLSA